MDKKKMKKGSRWTKKHREKMKIIFGSSKHRERCSQRSSGKNNPMYGKPITDEHRKNLIESHLGQIPWNKGNRYPQIIGINNGNWKGGTTPKTHKRLNDFIWIVISKDIKKRDNHTCQMCGKKNCLLDVHHIIPYRINKNDDPRNLITLCKSCHANIDNRIDIMFILLKILRIARQCKYIK